MRRCAQPIVVAVLFAIVAALGVWAARAQNLDDGKTAPQLFEADCSACHKSPGGLAKKNTGGALVSFLRQHYTSSSQSASLLAAYISAAPVRPERPEHAERKKGRGEESTGTPETRETLGQRKNREKTAVARPADEKTNADRRKDRKSRREGAPEPAVSQPPAAPATPPPATATAPAPSPGEGQTATAPPPAAPTGDAAASPSTATAASAPSVTPAAANAPPAPTPPPSRVADQPVFSTPLP